MTPGASGGTAAIQHAQAGRDVIAVAGDYIAAPVPGVSALHQLPPPPRDFTGRAAEMAELLAALEQGGVTISGLRGLGGMGKTALALKLAEQLAPRYPEGLGTPAA